MKQRVVIDTGPLVSALDRRDQWHSWSVAQLDLIQPPLLTCEAVISEAHFLLGRVFGGRDALLGLLTEGFVRIPWQLSEELVSVNVLLKQYESVPMSLADACLVRMVEQYSESQILTLDSDFQIYRMNRDQVIPVIMP
ncbi:MAG: pilus assembly protein [Cyanobacteria bacterium P01_G01_bin.54]